MDYSKDGGDYGVGYCGREGGGGNLHVAPLEGLAQALPKLGQEGCEGHAESHHHEQEAHYLGGQDLVPDCLTTAEQSSCSVQPTV